jgi:arylsulfatase A-like enzyme
MTAAFGALRFLHFSFGVGLIKLKMMKTNKPLFRCIIPALMAIFGSDWGLAVDRPNILFIYADDHSPKTISCYEQAYAMAHTPNIDRIAAEGVRFHAAYLGSWCMASRASVLTGLHPHAIESMKMSGKYPGSEYDPQQCRFWPAAFRAGGYQTAQIGKWHTGTDAGFGRDWDYQVVWNRPANPDNAGSYFGPQLIDRNGVREKVKGYSTDHYTRWASDYIRGEGREQGKPWFLWLCYGAIHGPTTPAERHKGALKNANAELPQDIFELDPGKPGYLKKIQRWKSDGAGGATLEKGKKSHQAWMQQAHECLMSVDEGVGEVLRALEESGQADNTLVIYTSDQGFANGEHGLQQKVAPYEATYTSPFVLRYPKLVPAGGVCASAVNAPDVVVTFFSLAGIPLPWPMHGRDLTPLLENPKAEAGKEPTLFLHCGQLYGSDVTTAVTQQKNVNHAGVPFYAGIRQQGLKYVRYFVAEEPEELYDLDKDPEELKNLVGDPAYQGELTRLRSVWHDELVKAELPFLDAIPQPSTASTR